MRDKKDLTKEENYHGYLGFMFVMSTMVLAGLTFLGFETYQWYSFTNQGVRTTAIVSSKKVYDIREVTYRVSYPEDQDSTSSQITSDHNRLEVGDNCEIFYLPHTHTAEFADVVTDAHKIKILGMILVIPITLLFVGILWPLKIMRYCNGEIFASS